MASVGYYKIETWKKIFVLDLDLFHGAVVVKTEILILIRLVI